MEVGEIVLSDRIELAVLYFKQKDYTLCLTIYNEIIKELSDKAPAELTKVRRYYDLSPKPLLGVLCHPKLLLVLDQRAATFEKLGNLPRALKDTQRAMTLDPLDPKGYLRAAKVYMKESKEVDAYKILQRGLYTIEKACEKHSVPVSESLLTNLKAKYKELNRKLKLKRQSGLKDSPEPDQSVKRAKSFSASGLQRRLDEMLPLPRSSTAPLEQLTMEKRKSDLDPMRLLPVDVIEQVFSYLPIRSLLRCHLVSKEWYSILISMPALYNDKFSLRHRATASEYSGGLRLMKRVAQYLYDKSIHSVRVWSTFNTMHLGRILESLVADRTLKLKRLEIVNRDFSLQLLLNKLEKCKWDLDTLKSIEKLRFLINRPILHPQLLLYLYPRLTDLDIVVADDLVESSFDALTPSESENYQQYLRALEDNISYGNLNAFSYISHTKYIEKRLVAQPKILEFEFPSLTRLTLVAFNFKNRVHHFGEFLAKIPSLRSLYLEDNAELLIKDFVKVLLLFSPGFQLRQLTFREIGDQRHSNLSDVDAESLPCLFSLEYLDIYGSFLSSKGLLKLLSIANTGQQLSTLNIGKCQNVYLRRDQFAVGRDVLEFSQIFRIVPQLHTLYLNEMDLDNVSMKFLHKDLADVCGYDNFKLKRLDISFCHMISGIGIMNLLNYSSSQPFNSEVLMLDELVLDGLDIHKSTINMLINKGIVKRVFYDPSKTSWKQKGVNTLEPW